jgi:type II restriction enzyme
MPSAHAADYKSGSQRARVVTEFWAEHNLYCPNCSSPKLNRLVANTKASDFICPACGFWYQLKGQKTRFGNSITDGAYESMMAAIRNDETPNFYFMQYDLATWSIRNLLLVPHFAFPPSAIIKRPPLSETARRAGWIGCNIALNRIPIEARIAIITTTPRSRGHQSAPIKTPSNKSLSLGASVANNSCDFVQFVSSPEQVREKFRKVKPLKDLPVKNRGWTLDVLNIVHRLGKSEFTNQDVYAFERELEKLHPDNRHIRDKIRQQLQNLAHAGLLIHAGRNDYRLK